MHILAYYKLHVHVHTMQDCIVGAKWLFRYTAGPGEGGPKLVCQKNHTIHVNLKERWGGRAISILLMTDSYM